MKQSALEERTEHSCLPSQESESVPSALLHQPSSSGSLHSLTTVVTAVALSFLGLVPHFTQGPPSWPPSTSVLLPFGLLPRICWLDQLQERF